MKERPVPQILWSWGAASLAVALPTTLLLGWFVHLFWPSILPIALPVWCGGWLVFIGGYLPLRRRSLHFRLEDRQITATGGVVFTTTRCIPLDAVRQVTLIQGPLERRLHTAFLLVSATGGYLLVEGIPRNRAEEWRKHLNPQ